MCEFQSFNPDKPKEPPMCDFTEQRCTFCIMSDADTYQKAKMVHNLPHYKRGVRK